MLFAQDLSLEKERALGEQLAQEFRRTTTPLESPSTRAWIGDLATRLAGPPRKFDYTFEIVADDLTAMHEAPAFPGGFVFVPAALILAAQSEDEFAGMLAHAIAHIEARHGTKQAAGAQTLNLATVPLIFIGGWMGNATPNGNRLAIPRAFLPVWRANELAADSLAAKMMSAAGYDPEALARYIEREQPESEERAQGLAAIRAVPAQRPASPHPDFRAVQEEIRRVSASITAERPPRLSK